MEIRIVVFLALAFVAILMNTALMIGAYLAFGRITSKLTKTVAQFSPNGATREWIASFDDTAKRAVAITESTKLKLAEADQMLGRAHENYRSALVAVDSRADKIASDITKASEDMRDLVAKPVHAVALGITKILEDL